MLLAALFGGSFVGIKAGLRELPPVLFASLRFDVAAVALLGYILVRAPRTAWLPRTRGDLLGIAAAGLLLVALNNTLLFVGQTTTTPAAASVLYGLNPVLAPVFAWWLLGDRLSAVGAVGIGIALAGVILVVQPSPSTFTGGEAAGQLLVLGAAAVVALGSVLLQRVETALDSVPLTAWAMAGGALLLHGVSLALGESPAVVTTIGPTTVASLLLVGIPATAIAYVIYFRLIDRVGSVRTNLSAYVVPVFATLTGWLLLGDVVSLWTVVGFVVVLGGFALVERTTLAAELRRLQGDETPESDQVPSPGPPCDD